MILPYHTFSLYQTLLFIRPSTYLSMYFHQYVPSSYQCDQIGRFLEFGQLFEALATINLSQSPTFLGKFCKSVKIFNFSIEIIFGQLLLTFGDFLLVTLPPTYLQTLFLSLRHLRTKDEDRIRLVCHGKGATPFSTTRTAITTLYTHDDTDTQTSVTSWLNYF